MNRAEVEAALAAAVEAESEVGIRWWPGVQMAPVAYRRWRSYPRRCQSRRPTPEHRIADLAKGLQAHFEPDVPYTAQAEWLHLARRLAEVFATQEL
jgi:hypothetical protein